jgi:hypothetical protein
MPAITPTTRNNMGCHWRTASSPASQLLMTGTVPRCLVATKRGA